MPSPPDDSPRPPPGRVPSIRGGGVLLRSQSARFGQLVGQNEELTRENEALRAGSEELRARLALSEEKQQACEEKLIESERKLEEALENARPKTAPPSCTESAGELLVDNEGKFTLKDAAGKVVIRAMGWEFGLAGGWWR